MSEREGYIEIPATLRMSYRLRSPAGGAAPRELIVLLHGFTQSGGLMLRKFGSELPQDAAVLAPDGPLPCPQYEESGTIRRGYSWYFYDGAIDEYLVDMAPSVNGLSRLIDELGFAKVPVRLVGYSQGGYLAPFLASELVARGVDVRQVIGVGSRFLVEELAEQPGRLERLLTLRVDAVHGGDDRVVDTETTRQCWIALERAGVKGELRVLPNLGHRLGPELVAATLALLT